MNCHTMDDMQCDTDTLTRYEAVLEISGRTAQRVDTDCSETSAVEAVAHMLYVERNRQGRSSFLVLVRRPSYWEATCLEGGRRVALRGYVHEIPLD